MTYKLPPLPPAERLPNVDYASNPKIGRLIFICGLHRSGTTLLERLLVARYELSYLRANVPESEGQHMQSVFASARPYGGPGRFAFSQKMQADLRLLSDHPACRSRIMADWHPFITGDGPVLLEKSPPNLTKIWWLRQVFPGALFIIMARDPRAAAAATRKWTNTSLPELMMHWNAAYSQAMADLRDSDCITLRYEDLTKDSRAELPRLADFLRLTPRRAIAPIEDRYVELHNTNDEYIRQHAGTRYGAGIWNQFGYDV